MSIGSRVDSYTLYFPSSINYSHTQTFTSKAGSVVWDDGTLVLSTGANANSLVSVTGYLPCYVNQEEIVTVTLNAAFSAPTAGCKQILGIGDGEEGVFIGYNGLQFGMMITKSGSKRYWSLQINANATADGTVTLTLLDQTYTFAVKAGSSAMQIQYSIAQSAALRDANLHVIVDSNSILIFTDGSWNFQPQTVDSVDCGTTGTTATMTIVNSGQTPVKTWIYNDSFSETGCAMAKLMDLTEFQVYRFEFGRWCNARITLSMLDADTNNYQPLHSYVPPTGFNTSRAYTPHVFVRNVSDNPLEAPNTTVVTLRTNMANISSGTPATNTNGTVFFTSLVANQVTVDSTNQLVVGVMTVPIILNGKRNRLTSSVSDLHMSLNASRSIEVRIIASGGITAPIATSTTVPWSTLLHGMPSTPTYVASGLNVFTLPIMPGTAVESEPKQLWLAPGTTVYVAIVASPGAPMTVDFSALVTWTET